MRRPDWTHLPSFGGRDLPDTGTGLQPIRLRSEGPLGPCKATVVAEAVRLESGRQRFRVVETWQPPHAGYGEITETTLVESVEAARELAGRAADEWRQGTGRSERLAPGGRLRAGKPTGRTGLIRAVEAFRTGRTDNGR
jgi:hypothetical protein